MTYRDMADKVGLKLMRKEFYISFMKVRWSEFDKGKAFVLAQCFLHELEDTIPDAESKRVLAKLRSSFRKGMADFQCKKTRHTIDTRLSQAKDAKFSYRR